MSPDPINLTSARLVNPTNTLNKYVYGGNNPLKYIDRDGEDITIFYRPSGLSPTDFGHIFIGALNQNTGQVGFLDYYPQGRGNGPGEFNPGNMQDRAATSDQFATLTIRTTPDQAQKVLDLITALKSGKAPDYAALSNNCTTICEDVLHDLGSISETFFLITIGLTSTETSLQQPRTIRSRTFLFPGRLALSTGTLATLGLG
jgi:hypothetical protein